MSVEVNMVIFLIVIPLWSILGLTKSIFSLINDYIDFKVHKQPSLSILTEIPSLEH